MPVGQTSLAIRPASLEDERPRHAWRKAEWLILLGYVLVAVLVTWHVDVNPAGRVPSNGTANVQSDIYLNIWFMRYTATAVAHWHLPALITTAVNAPHGINMMWNTSMLLPGVLLTPVTLLWGPSASLAVLLVLGFAGSASTLYFVLRRWGVSIAAAAIGGAVYGFSPALLVSAEDHYHLQFAVLPPLIADAVLRLATGRGRFVRTGAWLGLLVAAQIFIAEELLVDTALMIAILVAVLVLSRPSQVRDHVLRAAAGAGIALAVTLVICGHALLVQFRGPLTETGSPWHLTHYWIDPLDFVTAPNAVFLHGHFRHFILATHQWPVETMAYLGWPLLILAVAAFIAFWGDLRIRIAGVAFLLMEWMGVGNHKIVMHGYHVPMALLPWHYLVRVPVLNQVLPNRFPYPRRRPGRRRARVRLRPRARRDSGPARLAGTGRGGRRRAHPGADHPAAGAVPAGAGPAVRLAHRADPDAPEGRGVRAGPAVQRGHGRPRERDGVAGDGGHPDFAGRWLLHRARPARPRGDVQYRPDPDPGAARQRAPADLARPEPAGPSRPVPDHDGRGDVGVAPGGGRHRVRAGHPAWPLPDPVFGPPTVHVGATLGWRMPTGPVPDTPAADAR